MNDSFRVIAIISAFNEGDIISPVIEHLVENGVDVYLIDNCSTDDTIEQAGNWLGRGLLKIEPFPSEKSSNSERSGPFDWTAILHRKEALASELRANWFIHHDADEIRESPWPGMTLKEAIRWVDTLGYNCIDFRVLNFPPVDNGFRQGEDPRTYFTFCEDGDECDRIQLKCWRATESVVSLVPSGGHEVSFEGKRAFPVQFLLRHYPIRGEKHGRKKVFDERKGRFLELERSRGWHRQYDQFVDASHPFLRDSAGLRLFNLEKARLELMLPDKLRLDFDRLRLQKQEWESHAGNLEAERNALRVHAAKIEADREDLRSHTASLEQERDDLRKHTVKLEAERDELRKHASNLESERDELKNHAANLQAERDDLRKHTVNLEAERGELKKHAGNLERERDKLKSHAVNLEASFAMMSSRSESLDAMQKELEHRNLALERELAMIRQSLVWRISYPLRRLRDALRDTASTKNTKSP